MLVEGWIVRSKNGRQTAIYSTEDAAAKQSDIKDVGSVTKGELELHESDVIEYNRYGYFVV